MFQLLILTLLFFVQTSLSSNYDSLSCADYNRAYTAIDNLINANVMAIPGFVRLAFHDCLGRSCNGCLNFLDGHNSGLESWAASLNRIYARRFDTVMSRADFWQLAGQVALVRAASNRPCADGSGCAFPDLQFLWGRADCSTPPHSFTIPDDAGDAHGDYKEVRRVLHGNFKLSDKEIVAAMGAHTLGGAFPNASGFTLPWTESFLTFDNKFFQNMISLPYAHSDMTQLTPELQLVHDGLGVDAGVYDFSRMQFVDMSAAPVPLMLLNVDAAMWKDLKATKVNGRFTGQVSCTVQKEVAVLAEDQVGALSACKDNPSTAKYVKQFAEDLGAFYETFAASWGKINAHGSSGLEAPGADGEVCGNCIPEGALCTSGFLKSGQCCSGFACDNGRCAGTK